MDKHDAALDALLDSYTVEGADDALMARIFRETVQRPPAPATRHNWRLAGTAMAASALLGFWLGMGQMPAATVTVAQQEQSELDIDTELLGSTTINEVLL